MMPIDLRRTRGLSAALVLASVAIGHAQESTLQVIDDSSGNPLSSALVRLRKAEGGDAVADLETDNQGRAHISGVPPGVYSAEFSMPGFVPVRSQISIPAVSVGVRLARYAVFSGSIIGAEGHPPRRAAIAVFWKGPNDGELLLLRQAPLAADGSYSIELYPGEYAIGVWYNSVQDGAGLQLYPDNSHPQFFAVRSGELREVRFWIPPGDRFGISGKVELPRPGMQFLLTLGHAGQSGLPLAQTRTAPDGSFRLEGVRTGVYDLFAVSEASAGEQAFFGHASIRVAGQNVEGLNVAVSTGRTVQLLLRGKGSREKAPPGCPSSTKVWLVPAALQDVVAHPVEASFSRGETVAGLPPGRFRIKLPDLGAGCYLAGPSDLDLTVDGRDTVEVELASTGGIRGMLKSGPTLPGGYAVVLMGFQSSRIAFADAEGRFAFQGLDSRRLLVGRARPRRRSHLLVVPGFGSLAPN